MPDGKFNRYNPESGNSILIPAIQIVYKIILGRLLLEEKVPTTTWLAAAIMTAGMITRWLPVLSLSRPSFPSFEQTNSLCGANLYDEDYTLDSLLDLFLGVYQVATDCSS